MGGRNYAFTKIADPRRMASALQGTLKAAYDREARVISISGAGIWSVQTVETHFENLRHLLLQARRDSPFVRVFSDLREGAVQDASIAMRIVKFTADAYCPGDRIAIVVASSLLKMQMRRSVQNDETQLFLSPTAAWTWLRAYDEPTLKIQAANL